MSFYKYVSCENGLKILDGTIRLTQPTAFNDPFELVPEFYYPDDFKIDALQFELHCGDEDFDLTRLDETMVCNDFRARNLLRDLTTQIGILCLSKQSDSLLMWSHYADEYRGLLIEFDDKHEFFTGSFEVKYLEVRRKINLNDFCGAKKPIPISILCTKSVVWAYEKEQRVVRSLQRSREVGKDTNGNIIYIMEIPLECIKSITFGERTNLENQKIIWNKIKNTNIELRLAALANNEFKFRYDIIKYNIPFPEMSPQINPRTAQIFLDEKGMLGEIAKFMYEKHHMTEIANLTL